MLLLFDDDDDDGDQSTTLKCRPMSQSESEQGKWR